MPSIPDDPITFTCTLEARRQTVYFLAKLIHEHCERAGTRRGTRVLGPFRHAVMVLRWFLDATRVRQLAEDNRIGKTTCYDRLHEAIDLRRPRPGRTPGDPRRERGRDHAPEPRRHSHPHRPKAAPGLLAALAACESEDQMPTLTDLGYLNLSPAIRHPFKKPKGKELTEAQTTYNRVIRDAHGVAERANALFKETFAALKMVSLSPTRIGAITTAALVLLHLEHGRPLPGGYAK